jgi:hypothetical protein
MYSLLLKKNICEVNLFDLNVDIQRFTFNWKLFFFSFQKQQLQNVHKGYFFHY